MKKLKKIFRYKIVRTLGKTLTLIGISLTFAACYAPYPPDGFYDEPTMPKDEEVYGTNEQPTEEETPSSENE